MARCTRTAIDSSFVDRLFTFEKARNAFQKISRTVSSEESETRLRILAMSDAVITEAVVLFQYILQNLVQNERYVGDHEHSSCQVS